MTTVPNYAICQTISLMDALIQMEKHHIKYLIITDDDERVVGTLTDGDIRRALIKGMDIKEYVQKSMNKNFKYIKIDSSLNEVLSIFSNNEINCGT